MDFMEKTQNKKSMVLDNYLRQSGKVVIFFLKIMDFVEKTLKHMVLDYYLRQSGKVVKNQLFFHLPIGNAPKTGTFSIFLRG